MQLGNSLVVPTRSSDVRLVHRSLVGWEIGGTPPAPEQVPQSRAPGNRPSETFGTGFLPRSTVFGRAVSCLRLRCTETALDRRTGLLGSAREPSWSSRKSWPCRAGCTWGAGCGGVELGPGKAVAVELVGGLKALNSLETYMSQWDQSSQGYHNYIDQHPLKAPLSLLWRCVTSHVYLLEDKSIPEQPRIPTQVPKSTIHHHTMGSQPLTWNWHMCPHWSTFRGQKLAAWLHVPHLECLTAYVKRMPPYCFPSAPRRIITGPLLDNQVPVQWDPTPTLSVNCQLQEESAGQTGLGRDSNGGPQPWRSPTFIHHLPVLPS